ncbi:MAG: hypothetical protein RIC87_24040 [Kiloniellales bacterium]
MKENEASLNALASESGIWRWIFADGGFMVRALLHAPDACSRFDLSE